jgi:hypothetical protein
VLTVQLVRCIDLAPEGSKDLATFVKMKVGQARAVLLGG